MPLRRATLTGTAMTPLRLADRLPAVAGRDAAGAAAGNASTDLKEVLAEMSGGAVPTKVISTGHSLGGGLASLAGVWAALQWPAADVRVVALGSPMVGNQAWVDAFRAVVGRSYRVVNRRDIVPSLPPFEDYAHLPFPLWIQDNGTLVADDRPRRQVQDNTWNDHTCSLYKDAVFNVTAVARPGPAAAASAR
ncbi:hypothetical protein WJX81_002184 [Elliptochloris bilobata]|uniref:Fungal lipase-type domain-containing protein n=1 Tax=Elliptochloris bilobata TaxID=381761 RepID=A0AAW1QD12_9CHLO